MARTYFHDFNRDNGQPITVEYRFDDETCVSIIGQWPNTPEYEESYRKLELARDYLRHTISFHTGNDERDDSLRELEDWVADAEGACQLTDAERELMEAWLSENHIHESDDDLVF